MEKSSDTLERRYYCNRYSYYNNGDCYYSRWDAWGRWVLLGVIIFVAVFVFFLFSCIGARRRRKHGARPMYGTGWLAPAPPPGHGQMNYYGPGGNNQQQPYYNNNYNEQYNNPSNQGYYGQANGVEMQPPASTYQPQGGANMYAPPAGPPPDNKPNNY